MKLFKKKKTQPVEVDIEDEEASESSTPKTGRGGALVDFIMRVLAAIATLGSAIALATSANESLPFLERFIPFRAQYDNLPSFAFFLAANAIASGYLFLSLALSIFHILKSGARITRAILIIFDTVMLAFLTSGASAAAAIAHLAHKGNAQANWGAICHQYNSFCERVSGSLVGSFIGILVLLLLIFLSSIALSRS